MGGLLKDLALAQVARAHLAGGAEGAAHRAAHLRRDARAPLASYGMRTLSMSESSWHRQSLLRAVPGLLLELDLHLADVACSLSLARSPLGRVCIASIDSAGESP